MKLPVLSVRRTHPALHRVLYLVAAFAALALLWHGPIPQWADYHHFADARTLFGLANAWNVASNLPFALVGGWALWQLWPATGSAEHASRAWIVFAAAIVATAFGSAWYHLAPTNASLVIDRLPIAWACAVLCCAFMAERVDARWNRWPVLFGALALASAAVGWWAWTEAAGQSDLRAYLYLQILPMLCIPIALLLKLRRGDGPQGLPDAAWWSALALYAVAKAFEGADHAVLDALSFTSGHTIKHLLAAGAAFVVLRAAVRTARISSGSPR